MDKCTSQLLWVDKCPDLGRSRTTPRQRFESWMLTSNHRLDRQVLQISWLLGWTRWRRMWSSETLGSNKLFRANFSSNFTNYDCTEHGMILWFHKLWLHWANEAGSSEVFVYPAPDPLLNTWSQRKGCNTRSSRLAAMKQSRQCDSVPRANRQWDGVLNLSRSNGARFP